MFQPRVVYDYRQPEDDSYEKVNQEITSWNFKMFLHICCLFLIFFLSGVLSVTLNYHNKPDLVAWFHSVSYIVWLISFINLQIQDVSSDLVPRKEKEKHYRKQQLSGAGTNGPSNPQPQEGQSLPEYTETIGQSDSQSHYATQT
ncbi:hypothetical protein SPOG_02353 [Schizosaccharomyces cryophilus OY26]|uniref:Uncharacterized protein n=1 Tax=Schizosaccharomyces cryophilus (strain OY26 / ATCC MYA-4695 / CBS 11777 / NBRC 106824 / NRRL Y48691) TaxID=653667 RepID=S9XBK4_SCHCR|nr:uncharacterized protein SPOG_02353 [Schizosaccharomyces cryophilus OY26]EPY51176.1 hypothetical protein SPOG_02353 [Schizosaccharomyces cryophilus OY26]